MYQLLNIIDLYAYVLFVLRGIFFIIFCVLKFINLNIYFSNCQSLICILNNNYSTHTEIQHCHLLYEIDNQIFFPSITHRK